MDFGTVYCQFFDASNFPSKISAVSVPSLMPYNLKPISVSGGLVISVPSDFFQIFCKTSPCVLVTVTMPS